MPRGVLITHGAIFKPRRLASWSIAVPVEMPLLELFALMQTFGCYAQLIEGDAEVLLIPLDERPAPTGEGLAAFYEEPPPGWDQVKDGMRWLPIGI